MIKKITIILLFRTLLPMNSKNASSYSGGNQTVTVDQTKNGGTWVSLGQYNFSPEAGSVKLYGNDSIVRADAVRFVRQVTK